MIILQILLWIVLIPIILILTLFLILFILSLLPINVKILYENNKLCVTIKYLFINKEINLENKEKNDNKVKKNKPKDSKIKDTQKKADSKIIDISKHNIVDLLYTSGKFIKLLFKGIKFKNIYIQLPVYDQEPSQIAIKYGKVNAFFYNIVAVLENMLSLYFEKVNIIPDFNNEYENSTKFAITINGNAFNIIVVTVWAIIKLYKQKIIFPKGLRLFKKRKKRKKQVRKKDG